MNRPAQIDAFVADVVGLIARSCGLVAAYLVGSIATGDLAGAASDIDLMLVTARRLPAEARRRAGEDLADLAADAPLHGLEAVLYRAEVLARPRHPVAYELNVNAGPHLERSVSTDGEAAFWFTLDVSAARQHAISVLGPPADELIGQVPDADLRAALAESLQWHRIHGRPDADAVLTACRGLRWLDTGAWVSKTAAGEAYLASTASPVVAEALAVRRVGLDQRLDPEGVAAVQAELEALLQL